MDYPERPRMFVARFLRQMRAARLAVSAGPEVCWLLAVVAAYEDDLGYAKPVEFWNENLVADVGLRSVKQLDRVRSKAVRAGWLSYTPGGKGRAGKYHVNDMAGKVLPPDQPAERRENGERTARERGSKRRENGERTGEPSSLIPNPNPETSSLRSEVSCGEPLVAASPPDDVFLAFECNGPAKAWTLTAAKVAEYQQSFPGVDVPAECRKAWQWTRDNPERRKTAKGMARFLGTWLGRAQDRAGRPPAAGGGPYLSRGERVAERIKAAHMDLFTDLLGGTHDDRPDGQDGQGWGDGADPLALPPRGGAGPDEGVPG